MGALFTGIAFVISLYTGVYAVQVWRAGNRFGSAVVFLLAAAALGLAYYAFVVRA